LNEDDARLSSISLSKKEKVYINVSFELEPDMSKVAYYIMVMAKLVCLP
jgi:hypothetical protein